MRHDTHRTDRGTSLIEVVVAASIGVSLTIVLASVLNTTLQTQQHINMTDRSAEFGQEVMSDIRNAAFSSRRIYSNNTEGQGFFASLDTSAFPPLAGSRLPLVTSTGVLEPDALGVPQSGNALLFAIEDEPRDVTVGSNQYRVDRLRFMGFYLTQQAVKVVSARPDKLNVVRYVTGLYVDHASLDQIADAGDKTAVVLALRADGISYAWKSGLPVDASFFALLADGSVSGSPTTGLVLSSDADYPPKPMLDYRNISIAGNGEAPNVPKYCESIVANPLFPSAFEVKAVGPSGARKLLVRFVLLAGAPGNLDVATDVARVLTVRDL